MQRDQNIRIFTDGTSITITSGAYQVIERLISYWQVHQEHGPLDALGGQPLSYLMYDPWVKPEKPEGNRQLRHQLVWAMTFVCVHELAHIFDGHVEDRDVGGMTMNQAKEFFADMVAADLTTRLILSQGKEDIEWNDIGFASFFALVYLQLRPAFHVGSNWVDHLWKDNHPIGQFRFLVFRREFIPLIRIDVGRWGITFSDDEIDQRVNLAEGFWSHVFQGLGEDASKEWNRLTEHLNTSEDVQELVRQLKHRWQIRQQRWLNNPN